LSLVTDISAFALETRELFQRASNHARRLGESYLASEHLLLAILDPPENDAVRILRNLGASPEKIRADIEYMVADGDSRDGSPEQIRYTPRTLMVIDRTIENANLLGHTPIGIDHVLLGLLAVPDAVAGGVLERHGVSLDTARSESLRLRDRPPGTSPLGVDLATLTSAEAERQNLIEMIDQVRWTPERRVAAERLLRTMIDNP
jgi:ATP-dependent Clp protease ATP-binding subunit ClpC